MLEKIKEIVAESLNADAAELTEETSFKDDLGADSLDLFEMVMAFEEEFEVEKMCIRDRYMYLRQEMMKAERESRKAR